MGAADPPATPILARLLAGRPPVTLDAWAMRPGDLERVLALIEAGHERIVECGSGSSSIVLARLLAERERGSLHSIEHRGEWAAAVRERLAAEGLAARATVLHAPLVPDPRAEPGGEWYDERRLGSLPDGADLLLVDGPPAGEPGREGSRYPALPALAARLRPGAAVVLDDAPRPGERRALARWCSEHGLGGVRRAGERIAIGYMFSPGAPGDGAGASQTNTERNE